MRKLPSAFLPLILLFTLVTTLSAHADTKVLTAKGTYTMGDGETPSFAEAMVLQKARQTMLEQAGTYVESYTKVQNYQPPPRTSQTTRPDASSTPEGSGRRGSLVAPGLRSGTRGLVRTGCAVRQVPVQPDVVFLDLHLPKVDGFGVLKQVRADNGLRLVPVVLLSTSTEDEDRTVAYRLGANSYIQKPIDAVKYSEAVRQLGSYWLALNEPPLESLIPDQLAGGEET